MQDAPHADWIVSRYPAGYRFAFTIVHDADSAYSERLAPLFEVFDELGFRITVSAFALWATWARNGSIWDDWRGSAAPIAVPLCDPAERRFYQGLAKRGHEVALHTPSDTSNTGEEVAQAFELFHDVFGHYPAVYTEHSSRSNRDAQSHEGSDPTSPYYCRDVLLRYDPWIWVDGEGALREHPDGKYFEIPPTEPPIDRVASERYGLPKVFVRTGRWASGDGDGFLQCYSEKNIDTLEQDGGMALVYTHLDFGWLDPGTRRMRTDIKERLQYLAAKVGWFAPAGTILDRARAIEAVQVVSGAGTVTVSNRSDIPVERVGVRAPALGQETVIQSIAPGVTTTLVPATPATGHTLTPCT